MIRGLYTSASGMMLENIRHEITANNLANANTNGYRKDQALIKTFPEFLIQRVNDRKAGDPVDRPVLGKIGPGAIVDEIVTMHISGQIRETSNSLDFAINGDGFFVVETAQGEFYTRNGSFTLDAEGYLTTAEGHYVMGETGRIQLDNADNVTVDEEGRIYTDGDHIDTLRLVTVEDKTGLKKAGDLLFSGGQAIEGITGKVKQGYIETSNVNVLSEMVNMINITRAYEANQKVIMAHDHTLGQVMEVGKIK